MHIMHVNVYYTNICTYNYLINCIISLHAIHDLFYYTNYNVAVLQICIQIMNGLLKKKLKDYWHARLLQQWTPEPWSLLFSKS